MTIVARIKLRRDTAANWAADNPTLSAGELGFETDTRRFKLGDGSSAYNDLDYEVLYVPSSTKSSPTSISAAGGIGSSSAAREYQFIVGNGGPVTVTANPQITAGEVVGQELLLQGTSDANTVTIDTGTGLNLNGPCTLRDGSVIHLVWDGTLWSEVSRNDK